MYSILNSRMISFTYGQWVRYFQENAKKRLKIPFTQEGFLDDSAKNLIFPSIKTFERGENSEGAYLKTAAEEFSNKIEDPSYGEAVQLFIQEENVHSDYLARYMRWHGISKKRRSSLNRIFQILRRTMGIRSEVTVLVTAEIIALSYYSALGNAADSKALKSICRQMLHDELPHIVFQSYTLGHDRTPGKGLKRSLLMSVSSVAVWLAYSNLLRAGGYGLIRFLIENHMHLMESKIIASRYRLRHNSRNTVPAGIRT